MRAPRYHELYTTLRAWIRDGRYRPGDQIPTEPELCRLFGVSRITVRKAIGELVRESWLVRRQGKGTYVSLSASRPTAALDLIETRHRIADLAAATEVCDLKIAQIVPDGETQAALELPPGARVQRACHVRTHRGEPIGYIKTFVPLDIARRVPSNEMARQPMFELLSRAGVDVAEAEQWIGATLADVEAAAALRVDVGAPLLRLTRIVRDAAGRPVERVIALYRADAYQYRMRLAAQGALR
ncbi:MAG: GntR family transcriptional regulator [Steroidobacteraceae bacterium]|nr:GntR family transcriptional regulator [Steroidobacteraceae bacterium]